MSPYLDPASRAQLLGPLVAACPECGGLQVRHYCRHCDVFVVLCACDNRRDFGEHAAHRLYVWRPGGVVAIPPHPEGM